MKDIHESEKERLDNEEFIRTGISSHSLQINVNVTEEDMLKDLVQNTEGKNIKTKKPNQN